MEHWKLESWSQHKFHVPVLYNLRVSNIIKFIKQVAFLVWFDALRPSQQLY